MAHGQPPQLEDIMSELQIALSGEEREYLAGLLESVLRAKRVEEHRTRTPSYRQDVLHQ
jgi:hypothetical protein